MRYLLGALCGAALWIGQASAAVVPGTIANQITVGPGGSLEYTVPIPAIPGTAGMEPKLSLVYSSQSGPSAVGMGWSVSGLSKITRGPRDLATDGAQQAVRWNSTDALYLDGQRLIPITTNPGSVEYRKALDDQSRIVAQLDAGGSPVSFMVRTRAGLILSYGGVAQVAVGGATADWLLSRVADTAGNYVDFQYLVTGADFDIQSIQYTGHTSAPIIAPYAVLSFEYATVPLYASAYVHGQKVGKTRRLTAIHNRLTAQGVEAYTVNLTYEDTKTVGAFRLTTIQNKVSTGEALAPLAFKYSDAPAKPWQQTKNLQLPVELTQGSSSESFKFMRTKAGVPASLVFSAEGGKGLHSVVFDSTTAGWAPGAAPPPPAAFTDLAGGSRGAVVVDLDGDGLDDLLVSRLDHGVLVTTAYRQGASWSEVPGYASPIAFASDGVDSLKALAVDLDGGGRQDIVGVAADGRVETLWNTGTGWRHEPAVAASGLASPPELVDSDCDGRPELVALAQRNGRWTLLTYGFDAANGWAVRTAQTKDIGDAALKTNFVAYHGKCGAVFIGLRDPTSGAVSTKAFVAQTTGWREAVELAPPPALFWSSLGKPTTPRAEDLDGDGLSDLIANETWADGTAVNLTYIQLATADPTGTRWRLEATAGGLSPPLRLAKDGKSLDSVLFRQFDADPHLDIIDLALRGAGEVGAYKGTGTTWLPAANYSPPIEFAAAGQNDIGLKFVDLNGDGLVDILFNRKPGTGAPFKCADGFADRGAFINRGDHWDCVDGYIPPLPFPTAAGSAPGVALVDVNGDGFVDLVYSYRTAAGELVQATYLNGFPQGTEGWLPASAAWKPPVVVADERNDPKSAFRILDVNGDGRPDLIRSYQTVDGKLVTEYYQNTGAGFASVKRDLPAPLVIYKTAFTGAPSGTPAFYTYSELVDVDGDRVPDFVEHYFDQKGKEVSNVYRWDGASYLKTGFTFPIRLDEGVRNNRANGNFIDVNGDGLADFYFYDGAAAYIYVATGAGWEREGGFDVPARALSDAYRDAATRLIDVNGDGLPDLVFYFATDPGKHVAGAYLNAGDRWVPADDFAPPIPFLAENGTDLGVRPIDVDGNGLPDFVKSIKSNGALEQETWINTTRRADVLEAATDSLGVVSHVQYQSLGEYRPLTPGDSPDRIYEHGTASAWPSISVAPAMYVVARLVTDEGGSRLKATRFRYGDLRMDIAWSRSLGFAWKDTIDEASGLITRTEFNQDPTLVGLVTSERTTLPDPHGDHILNVSKRLWTPVTLNGAPRPDGQPFRYIRSQLTQTHATVSDLTGAVMSDETTVYSGVDPFGNVGVVTTTRPDGSSLETRNTYVADPDGAWLGRLQQSEVIKKAAGAPSAGCTAPFCERKLATFTYDPVTGILRTEVADAQSAKYAVQTSYERDSFGNVKTRTLSTLSGPPLVRTETFGYLDDQGRLLVEATDTLQQKVTKSYTSPLNLAFAAPDTETDANHLVTNRTYDGFGHLRSERDPSGVVATTKWLAPAEIPTAWLADLSHSAGVRPKPCSGEPIPTWHQPDVAYAVVVQKGVDGSAQLQAPEIALYERAGRVIRHIKSVFDGSAVRLSFTDTEFDDLGRPSATSLPYFAGSPSHWALAQYDRLGRAIASTSPAGACVKSTFDGLKVTIHTWSSANKPVRDKVILHDQQGATISIQDAAGGIITYGYDAGGRISQVKGAAGATIQFTYDDGGHRSGLSDPDSGVWQYEYDGFGRLVLQRDPVHGSNGRRLEYDGLSRISRVITADSQTTWSFRPVGTPCGGGRIDSIEKKPLNAGNGPTYREAYEYDGLCRVQAVNIDVTASPAAAISPYLPASTYRSEQSYDDFGRPRLQRYPHSFDASTFVTQNSYDPSTGVLVSVDEVHDDGSRGRQLWARIAADASQRVTQERRGQNVVLTRSLDAMTGAVRQQSGRVGQKKILDIAYSYDDVGNLLARRDAFGPSETYGYDQLDRLTKVADPAGAAKKSVRYDASGRITSKSDVGDYLYGATCGGTQAGEAWRPANGLCGVAVGGALKERYRYDEEGEMIRSPTGSFAYNADNQLSRIVYRLPDTGQETAFAESYAYGPGGSLFLQFSERQSTPVGFRSVATYKLGLYENEIQATGRSKVVVDRFYIAGADGVVGFVESADYSQTLDPQMMPMVLAARPAANRQLVDQLFFTVRDRLGSVSLITTAAGAVVRRFAYDPWGRTAPPGQLPQDGSPNQIAGRWSEGFLGRSHLLIGSGVTDLVHLGGRVYDSRLAVFLSPDPLVTDPTSSQDLNPYLYANGNPLKFTDPSGYGWLSDFFSNPFKAVVDLHRNFINEVGKGLSGAAHWVQQNWREVAAIAVGVVIAVYCPPCMANPMIGGFIIGAAQAGTEAALYGGNGGEVLDAALHGGALGALGGTLSFAAGSAIQGAGWSAGSWQAATAHGVAGGVTSVASGGRFETGFATGALTQAVTHNTDIEQLQGGARYAANAALGGVTAEMGGGKFANGALYAAFQNLFNDELHKVVYEPPPTVYVAHSVLSEDPFQWGEGADWVNWKNEFSVGPTIAPKLGEIGIYPSIDLDSGKVGLDFSYEIFTVTKDGDVGVGPNLAVGPAEIGGAYVSTNFRTSEPNASINARLLSVSYKGTATLGDAWANFAKNLNRAVTAWACSNGGCQMGAAFP